MSPTAATDWQHKAQARRPTIDMFSLGGPYVMMQLLGGLGAPTGSMEASPGMLWRWLIEDVVR